MASSPPAYEDENKLAQQDGMAKAAAPMSSPPSTVRAMSYVAPPMSPSGFRMVTLVPVAAPINMVGISNGTSMPMQSAPQQSVTQMPQPSTSGSTSTSTSPADIRVRFQQYVRQKELNPVVADKLYEILSTTEVVLLCDDSDSMAQALAEEGTDPFAPKRSTRWLELKRLASDIINLVTNVNERGLDIYFLNRPKLSGVTNPAGLQSVFSVPPTGSTPLVSAIEAICREKCQTIPRGRRVLLVVITDGEPAGGPRETRENLRQTLINATQSGQVHVSFSECTDQADDMEYLDQWDGVIRNFDNTDDYREELARVRNVQGMQFKYDFNDHVAKILLATFDRWFYSLDQVKVADSRTGGGGGVASSATAFSYSQQQQPTWSSSTAGNPNWSSAPASYQAPPYTAAGGTGNFAPARTQAPATCCVIM